MNGYALAVVLCSLAATVVDACSQPSDGANLDLPAIVQQADLVVSGRYMGEAVVSQRYAGTAKRQLIQKVVDMTFSVASVHRLSRSVAEAGCTPDTITVRGVVLFDGCVDFRRSWSIGWDYILALKQQSGEYTLFSQPQLCIWSSNDANVAAVQQTSLAPGQLSEATATAICLSPPSLLPTTTTVATTTASTTRATTTASTTRATTTTASTTRATTTASTTRATTTVSTTRATTTASTTTASTTRATTTASTTRATTTASTTTRATSTMKSR